MMNRTGPGSKTGPAMLIIMLTMSMTAMPDERRLTILTVEEEAGVERVNEPVTMGIPLPEGAVRDIGTLALLDASGTAVPCQFFEVSRWRSAKGGVRWIHADFQVSVPAGERVELALADMGRKMELPSTPLTATVSGDTVTVVTGPLKFNVRGNGFNGFDGAWFDPAGKGDFGAVNLVVPPGNDGGSVVSADGKTARSVSDAESHVEIERSGPMRVTVKVEGAHKTGSGEKLLDYIVRFHAYAGSPAVRVQHTFVNRQGSRVDSRLLMTDLGLEIPTVMAEPIVTAGTDDMPWTGKAAGTAVTVLQRTSDELVVFAGDKPQLAGKGKSVKPLSAGWMDLGGPKGRNMAAGIRWFWQMNPKSVSALPDGTLRLGLFPSENGTDHEVFRGQSRTHDITFLFHAGAAPEKLNGFFSGVQLPLRAFAARAYYCRETMAFGPVAESSKALFGEDWIRVAEHDAKLGASIDRIIKKLDGHKYGPRPVDSYGFYAWGDQYHWHFPKKEKSPNDRPEWHLSWAGNYYDYPNACLLQFMRTGDKRYRDRWECSARHAGDVFVCHWHDNPALIGACRYCPARNHVALDNGAPYVSGEFNHAKSQSIFNHYYLYGDLRSLDNALLLANNALNNHAADTGWAARGLGAHLAQLRCAWELTGERRYLDRLKDMAERGMEQTESGSYAKGGKFMWGIAYEGMVYAYWATSDERIAAALKSAYDARLKDSYINPNMALGAAFVYRKTGDSKYRDFAWNALAAAEETSRPKSFGLMWRNAAYALYYLSNAYADTDSE